MSSVKVCGLIMNVICIEMISGYVVIYDVNLQAVITDLQLVVMF